MDKRYWEWDPVFEIDPAKSTLLIIDMQNGFVEEGAPLEVPMAREQVPAIAKLARFCREHKIPVIYTAFCVAPGFSYPFYWKMASQRGLKLGEPERMFWWGKHETEICPRLRPQPGEPIVKKCGYDAFANTELEQLLRSQGVDTVVVVGTVVNWCVDSTVRGAFHRFYNVVVVADCVSGYDHAGSSAEKWREMELDFFAEAFARVITSEDLIKELSSG
jgi:nicotinamidase-related amidase